MAENGISLPITKPVSVWNKPLKVDFRDFFKSLSKGVAHLATGNWEELAGDAADALSAVGFEKDPGQAAWLLIRRALTYAIYNLVAESVELINPDAPGDPNKFCETLDLSLEESELKLDTGFFERPQELSVLTDLQGLFKQWLIGYGVEEADAKAIASRLSSYFVYSLHTEWRKSPKRYGPIRDSFETPFTRAGEREQAWARYNAWLKKQVSQNIFGETFGLADVYVPLRASYSKKTKKGGRGEGMEGRPGEKEGEKQVVVDIETQLDNWITRRDGNDAIRIVTGGPGCGKSCFAKMFSAKHAQDTEVRTLFIPLHLFDVTADFAESVRSFVEATGIMPDNPLDAEKGEKRLLIILDGLDELSMQGRIGAELAGQFLEQLEATVSRRNMTGLNVQVLVTGRELVVQSNEAKFRKPGQILYILPYHLSKQKLEKHEYEDPKGLLKQDQRHTWWKRYGRVKGVGHSEMPKTLDREDLEEITAQPLLNYLISLSLARGKLDFSKAVNLNSIYEDLVEAVYERGYEAHPHQSVRELKFGDFVRVLEEISVAAWHGRERTTTIREIEQHCKKSGVSQLLAELQKDAKEGVTNLLTAFYFRRCGYREGGEKTFEFTHKSFREYLTGKRIVRALAFMNDEFKRKLEYPESIWSEQEALRYWTDLCAATAMDEYLFRFLQDELRLAEAATVGQWQKMLARVIGFMLRHAMPMERATPRPNYKEEIGAARNAEEALLAALSACAQVTEKISKIDWPEKRSAGAWLAKLQPQRFGSKNTLAFECLDRLDLNGCVLFMRDLYRANLRDSDLTGGYLSWACLSRSQLEHANLRRAHLRRADLQGAKLEGAYLEGAYLEGAYLEGANLEGAYLEGANLEEAKLEGANLEGANLEGANLKGAKLKGANLKGANLEGANLEGASGLPKGIRES